MLGNGEETLTAQSMYYIFNTKIILIHMWEIFTSHAWTATCKDNSSCLNQGRDRNDSITQAVTGDGFMRIINHISSPRYPKFSIKVTNQLMQPLIFIMFL